MIMLGLLTHVSLSLLLFDVTFFASYISDFSSIRIENDEVIGTVGMRDIYLEASIWCQLL